MKFFRSNSQIFSLVGITFLVMIVFSTLTPVSWTSLNLHNILIQSAAVVIGSVGMTFVITSGGIDLSLGSIMNLAVVIGLTMYGVRVAAEGDTGWGIYPIVIGVAVLLGAINGVLISRLRVHPLLITLATLNIYRGIATHITEAGDRRAGGAIEWLARDEIAGIGLPVFLAVVMVVIGELILRRTTFGRHVIAMGGSKRSAVENNINVPRIQVIVYSIAGLSAGLAALVIAGRIGTMQTSLGLNFEFTVITAVIVGGTSLLGGRGTVIGSAVGAVLLAVIDNGLNLANASIYIYDVVRGLVLVLAVVVDVVVTRRSRAAIERKLARRKQSVLA